MPICVSRHQTNLSCKVWYLSPCVVSINDYSNDKHVKPDFILQNYNNQSIQSVIYVSMLSCTNTRQNSPNVLSTTPHHGTTVAPTPPYSIYIQLYIMRGVLSNLHADQRRKEVKKGAGGIIGLRSLDHRAFSVCTMVMDSNSNRNIIYRGFGSATLPLLWRNGYGKPC